VVDWFGELAARRALPARTASALEERGFAILPGPVPHEGLNRLTDEYEAAFASAGSDDLRVGSTSTKLTHVVDRGGVFEALVVFPPLLDACCRVIGRPFKLSTFIGRTLRAGSPSQELHVDVRRDSPDWPLLGFILMVDEFRPDNGATRVVPGSHRLQQTPDETMADVRAEHRDQTLACGDAGSLLVFNGSVWHGHTANMSSQPRRSVQGAFIPREGRAATDFSARVSPETRARLDPLARSLLALS
jgi:hypothetical protein